MPEHPFQRPTGRSAYIYLQKYMVEGLTAGSVKG